MNISFSAKTLGLMAAATLTLAACSPASDDAAESVAPSASMSQEAMESTEPSHSAMAEDSMDADAPAADVAEQLQFTTTLLADGAEFDGASLAGVDTILWFWAPWCPTCQAEAPGVAEAAASLPEGVQMLGVPGLSDEDAMKEFTAEYGIEDMDQLVDADGLLWRNFEVYGQPAFALINDDGTITIVPGAMSTEGILEAADNLLAS
ncbi:redoxin domain-containing protein [Demequina aurantiaca]|uniref:redoxin domain-containing protein n=1 Tax=Demequina aurantiaca TaxID=676200 RepID=UPI003D329996